MHLGIASLMSMRVGLVFLTTLPTYLVGKLILKSQVIYDPAYMNEEFNNIWRKHGYTTINEYKNFFDDENLPEKEVFDVIVSK